jgi:hypothetical protein
MWLPLIVTLTCLFISTPRFAHGADQHVLGTITALDAKHVEVKTSKGQVDVQVNNKTRYKDQHNPKGTTMPEVGDRVIIIATKNDKKGAKKGDPLLLATEIHFSTAKRVPISREPVPVE